MTTTVAYVAVRFFSLEYTEIGGINPQDTPISLREEPALTAKEVDTLLPNAFARITSPTDRWIYFYSVNQSKTIFKKDFELGYSRVFKRLVLKTDALIAYESSIIKYSPWLIGASSVLLSLLFLWSLLVGLLTKRKRYSSSSELFDELSNSNDSSSEVQYVSSEISSTNENAQLLQIETLKNERKEMEACHRQFVADTKKEREKYERQFFADTQKENAELALTYNNNLALKEEAIIQQKLKFDKVVKQASILGVDLENSNIGNLVKGRLFELFAATICDKDTKTTIEDWTPDKGINDGIYVKSNGNPDFLLSFKDRDKMIALECKYRSFFKPDNKGEERVYLTLDKSTVFDRYKKYKEEKKVEVLVLFGVEGSAESPDNLYLVPLDDIDKIKHKYFDGYDTTRNKISEFEITKHQLIKRIKGYAK